jgi:hypothetical protein
MERKIVPILEEIPTSDGWSAVKIVCGNDNCGAHVALTILFEEGMAVAVKEDSVVCPKCQIQINIDPHLRVH